MKIEVTMEKVSRIAMGFDATPEQIAMLDRGENPFLDEMEKAIDNGEGVAEYDYAVCDEHGNTIIDWS
ncbi:MAG: hypothetical protein NC084_06400 [Bacteroides sp.]|nr:hypothetical protein [Eubacterium sp.]MCM1418145.1 hypothetical protein [Roseburia sp.]MCM1462330.1 hypothetical protein [Bacteroides sp.]